MRHFPLFLNVNHQTVIVSGSGEAAAAKLRLLLKTRAKIRVFGTETHSAVRDWADQGQLEWIERRIQSGDVRGARLLYCANDEEVEDQRSARIGRADGALVCIVDNLKDSDFITPAIVDRDPVTVAIGTEGTAPVLARKIKADLETRLPTELGTLAIEAREFRHRAAQLPEGRVRRNFWARFFSHEGMRAFTLGGRSAVQERLQSLFDDIKQERPEGGKIVFAGSGDGDPGNLTLNVRQAVDQADVIFHDDDMSPRILELARREAEYISRPLSLKQAIDILLQRVENRQFICVLLRDTSPRALFMRQILPQLERHNIDWHIHPGIVPELSMPRSGQKVRTSRQADTNSPRLKVG